MNVSRRAAFIFALIFALHPRLTAAQSATTGTIAGVARDTTGAVLPGVTVEAASPVLIEKVRSVVTDDQGAYKIVDLRPGVYAVTFTLQGFSTYRREGLELNTGVTANINAEMKVGALEETVTVTGASPVVDVQNVRQQTVFNRQVQEALPLGRNVAQWATVLPGASVGGGGQPGQDVGGTAGKATYIGIHGIAPGGSMGILQDGMTYRTAETAGFGLIANQAGTQETVLQTSGVGAEIAYGAVQMNVVPREGGNSFSLFSSGSFANSSLQSDNITDELKARGAAGGGDLRTLYLVNVGVGGRIVRDRLWFYSAHQRSRQSRYQPGNYFNATQNTLFYTPDLSRQAITLDTEWDRQVRVTWQATAKNKINVHAFFDGSCQCYFLQGATTAPEAAARIDQRNPYYQATWSHPRTSRLLLEAGTTLNLFVAERPWQPGVTAESISVLDSARNYRYGALGTALSSISAYGPDESSVAIQKFSASYVTGSHGLKVGFYAHQGWRTDNSQINKDLTYTFRGTVPQSVTYWATPSRQSDRSRELAAFVQDQWTVARWTLNLGARFDHFRGYVPEQDLPAGSFVPARDFAGVDNIPNWKDISPRLGMAYDLFGNGKTALKAAYGRYLEWETAGTAVTPNNPVVSMVTSATRTWNDVNGDYKPQDNELGPLSNSNFGKTVITTRRADDVLLGWGTRRYNQQAAVQVQHELRSGIAVNVGYFRTWFSNFVTTDNVAVAPADFSPYCLTGPVDSRLPGGGGDQICGLYDILPAKFGLVDNLVTQVSNFGKQTQVFNGVDATVNLRADNGALLTGGISTGATKTDDCDAIVDSPQKRFCRNSPSWSSGTQVKFSAVYPLPGDFRFSAVFQNIPGIPITASYVASNGEIAPSLGRNLGQCRGAAVCNGTLTVELIEPNTMFEDRLTQVDLRVTRSFRLRRLRLQGNLDVFNAFNEAAVLSLNSRYGPSWLQPTAILGGRIVKLGFQLDM
jgi:hypothetical protein